LIFLPALVWREEISRFLTDIRIDPKDMPLSISKPVELASEGGTREPM